MNSKDTLGNPWDKRHYQVEPDSWFQTVFPFVSIYMYTAIYL